MKVDVKIDNALLEKAIIFGTEKHAGQVRKGNNTPYILHPLRLLTHLVLVKPDSKNLIMSMIVLVLHDVVEDCEVSLDEIAREFGHTIAGLVGELTTDPEESAKVGKAQYLLTKMLGMTSYALRYKLIDRYDNVCEMKALSELTIQKTKKDTLFILDGLEKRKLTGTHKKLIKMIRKVLNKY